MANKLTYGQYHITSVGRDKYLGVSDFNRPPPASASVVVLRENFLPPEFTVVPVDVEADNYVILVGRMVTRDRDNRVFTLANEPAEVWLIRYDEAQKAYTIEKKGGMRPPVGWTAPSVDRAANPDQILVEMYPVPGPSELFKFERVAAE